MPAIVSTSSLRSIAFVRDGFVRVDQQGGTLTASGTRAHFWQLRQRHMENEASSKAARIIRDSVCAHCGKALGTRLFNQYLGSKSLKGRAFTGGQVANLLRAATERNLDLLVSRHVDSVVANGALRQEILAELGHIQGRPEDFINLVGRSIDLLEGDFFGRQSHADAAEEHILVHNELSRMRLDLMTTTGTDNLRACVEDLMAQLRNMVSVLAVQQTNNPFTGQNVNTAFAQMYEAYEQVITQHQQDTARARQQVTDAASPQARLLGERSAALAALLASVQAAKASPPEMQGVGAGDQVAPQLLEQFVKLPETLGRKLHDILPDLKAGELAKAIKAAYVQVLNRGNWPVIDRTIQYFGSHGESVIARSIITPARHIGSIGPSMAADGINGVSCEDRGQQRHALNLACTALDVMGQPLFRGIRHGINSAYTIKDPAVRLAANAARAREIFTAALQSSPERLRAAEQAGPGDVIELPLLSTSLITPDKLREVGGRHSERTYLAEQCASWKDACTPAGTCQVDIVTSNGTTKTVTVHPTVLTFNFGVNAGAQHSLMQLGWHASQRYNEEAMRQLFGPDDRSGLVGNFLAQPAISQQVRDTVSTLRDQILDLWHHGTYRQSGQDPYRLPARLAMLGHVMGMMPLFNCKSGKDRTGQMDVACKTLALQIHESGGAVPAPDADRSHVDQQIFHQVAINSGNLEMQRLNTGLAGFKTSHVAGLDALFSQEARDMHRGLSHYVKV